MKKTWNHEKMSRSVIQEESQKYVQNTMYNESS